MNSVNMNGETVLMMASEKRNFDYVKLLLENKANTMIENKRGDLAIDIVNRNASSSTNNNTSSLLCDRIYNVLSMVRCVLIVLIVNVYLHDRDNSYSLIFSTKHKLSVVKIQQLHNIQSQRTLALQHR